MMLLRWAAYGTQLQACTMTFPLAQILAFNAATGKALTIFRAGFAFTFTILPKISRLPAFVAGFVLSLSLARPGIAKTPVFLTSLVATLASWSSTLATSAFLSSVAAASASERAPLLMAGAAFFIAFIGAMAMPKLRKLKPFRTEVQP